MTKVGSIERINQNRVVKLFQEELDYTYLGDWEERTDNSNIEVDLLTDYLNKKGYSTPQITKAIHTLKTTASNFSESLYTTNKNVYALLRYGADIKTEVGKNTEKIHFIDWKDWQSNDFAIAEEVTIKENKTKRPPSKSTSITQERTESVAIPEDAESSRDGWGLTVCY